MSSEDAWSTAEIVRALQRIEAKIEFYAAHFVPRELHDEQQNAQDERHGELAKWVTDIAASLERTNRDVVGKVSTSTARWVVGVLVMALLGVLSFVVAIH